MNFTRFLIVIPAYAAIVVILQGSGLSEALLSLPLELWQLWAVTLFSLALGVSGAWLMFRPNAPKMQRHTIALHVFGTGCIGIFFAAVFGVFDLMMGRYPYLPNLIIIPTAFMLAEAIYIIAMRAWMWRKTRHRDFDREE